MQLVLKKMGDETAKPQTNPKQLFLIREIEHLSQKENQQAEAVKRATSKVKNNTEFYRWRK